MSTNGNGSNPTPEALAFHNSRLTQQGMSGLRKLTAIELLGRAPVPISIPEFDGAVFYFAHPSASTIISFYQMKERLVVEAEKAKTSLSQEGQGDEANREASAAQSSFVDFYEQIHRLTCGLLTEMIVDENGIPIFHGDEIADKMSRENFQILSTQVFEFLNRGRKSTVDQPEKSDVDKSDEEIQGDLITLEDELDVKASTVSTVSTVSIEETEPKNH